MTIQSDVRRRWIGAMLAIAAAGTILGAAPAAAQQEETFDWSGRISEGATLEIKGVNGGISAVPASGREASVSAVKSGERGDPASVRIEVVEHQGGVTICAVYPTPAGERSNECRPGEGGRMSVRNNDVQVEFTVRVPAGTRFVARTVNGGIEATDLAGDVEATTVNGSVEVRTSETASVETVNGSIRASIGRSGSPDRTLRFETVNGAIQLSLPAGAGARVRAETTNGELETDFPLTIRGFSRAGPRRLDGTIGNGGPLLELRTVNGGIQLRQEG